MRQIRMSGTEEDELKAAVKFILSNPEYASVDNSEIKITNIEIKNKCIYAYSYGNNRHFKDRPGMLPVPLSIDAFIAMIIDWWKAEEPFDVDYGFDGTVKKGFLTTSGKDWGSIQRDDGGFDVTGSIENSESEIKCDNLHDIIIAVNNQYYGK